MNRRGFLTALGLGVGGLALPGMATARGFRRGRHRGCCSAPPVCSECGVPGGCVCGMPGGVVPGGRFRTEAETTVYYCPTSRAQMNGVYYYSAVQCPSTPSNFTSSKLYDIWPCTGDHPELHCLVQTYGGFLKTAAGGKEHKVDKNNHKLKKALDPGDGPVAEVGDWQYPKNFSPINVLIDIEGGRSDVPVRLFQLILTPPQCVLDLQSTNADTFSGATVTTAFVGQESTVTATQKVTAKHSSYNYYTIDYPPDATTPDTYHVLVKS